MKHSIVFILLIVGLAAKAQKFGKYSVEITLSQAVTNGKAYLRYFSATGIHIDSSVINNGKFSFSGALSKEIMPAKIWFLNKQNEERPENACEVFLEPHPIKITSNKDLLKATFSGSQFQIEYTELLQSLVKMKTNQFVIDEEFRKAEANGDTALTNKYLIEEYPRLFIEKQQILGSFIQKYPASLVSVYKFEEFAGDEIVPTIVEPVYNKLSAELKKHPKVRSVAKRIIIAKNTGIGMEAPEFIQADTLGEKISLYSFRGKYVLVDFWASWCGPCRAETPRLVKLYDQFKGNEFEIFSVSLDGDRKPWIKAIVKDKMIWQHGSDLKIFENEAALAYGITSIPQNILIDPSGKIIAKNLQGSNLEKKLKDILGTK